jgi:NAD(P)-dependent dehydrogenase (short-subunit alcohol dehydrogenase family)
LLALLDDITVSIVAVRARVHARSRVQNDPVESSARPRAVRDVLCQRPVDHVVLSTIDGAYGAMRDTDIANARRVTDSKLFGSLHIAKHARLPAHGSMILVSGIAADRPSRGGAVVAAVNGAIHALVRALAVELAPTRVNALSPGWVDTPAWDRIAGADKQRRLAERARTLPVARVGVPDDLAHAAMFLLENPYTTGEVLHVDGGHRVV